MERWDDSHLAGVVWRLRRYTSCSKGAASMGVRQTLSVGERGQMSMVINFIEEFSRNSKQGVKLIEDENKHRLCVIDNFKCVEN